MRRILFASGVMGLLVVVVSAQPPVPSVPPTPVPVPSASTPPLPPDNPALPKPPQPLPMPPAPTPPVAATEIPLSKFEPLASFPTVTQFAVRGVLLGSTWMAKMHQSHGRFLYGYNPTLRQPISGEHDLKQAQTVLALAEAAKFSGDQKHAAIASQAILALLASTKVSPIDPNCRVPVQASIVCNRVAFAAILALAIYEMPHADQKLIDDAERLCAFIRTQLRADGSVHYTDNPTDVPTQTDPAGVNEYPGYALQALAVSNRIRPAEWKKDAVKRGIGYYHTLFRAKPHPMLAATLTPCAFEHYLQTKLNDAATAIFEMNDWLCSLQIVLTDPQTPQWAGGFRSVEKGTKAPPTASETGLYVQSLACADQLTRLTGDLTRERKFRPALLGAVEFLCGLQFSEANTRHFENLFRANMLIGAFHLTPNDGNLHTDATACAILGLLQYLSSGAERNGP